MFLRSTAFLTFFFCAALAETREAMADLAVDNVLNGVHGKPMKAEVKLR